MLYTAQVELEQEKNIYNEIKYEIWEIINQIKNNCINYY